MNIRVLRKLAWFALPLATLFVACGEDDDTSWKDQLAGLQTDLSAVQADAAANKSSLTTLQSSFDAGEYVTGVALEEGKLVVSTNKASNKSTLTLDAGAPVVETKGRIEDGQLIISVAVDGGNFEEQPAIALPDFPQVGLKQTVGEDGSVTIAVTTDGSGTEELTIDLATLEAKQEAAEKALADAQEALEGADDAIEARLDAIDALLGDVEPDADTFAELQAAFGDMAVVVDEMKALVAGDATLAAKLAELDKDIVSEIVALKAEVAEAVTNAEFATYKTTVSKLFTDLSTSVTEQIGAAKTSIVNDYIKKCNSRIDSLGTVVAAFGTPANWEMSFTESGEIVLSYKDVEFAKTGLTPAVIKEMAGTDSDVEISIEGGSLVVEAYGTKDSIELDELDAAFNSYLLVSEVDGYYALTLMVNGEKETALLPLSPIAITGLELQAKYVDDNGAPVEVVKASYLLWNTYEFEWKDGAPVTAMNDNGIVQIAMDEDFDLDEDVDNVQKKVLLGAYSPSDYRVSPSGVALNEDEVEPQVVIRLAERLQEKYAMSDVKAKDVEDIFGINAKYTDYQKGILSIGQQFASAKPWSGGSYAKNVHFFESDYDYNYGFIATLKIKNPLFEGSEGEVAEFVYSEEYGIARENLGDARIVFKGESSEEMWDGNYVRYYNKVKGYHKSEERPIVTGFPTTEVQEYLTTAVEHDADHFEGVGADYIMDCGASINLTEIVFDLQTEGAAGNGVFLADLGFDMEKDFSWEYYMVNGGDDKGTEEGTEPVYHFGLENGELQHEDQTSSIFNWVDVLAIVRDAAGNIVDHLVVRFISVPVREPILETQFSKLDLVADVCYTTDLFGADNEDGMLYPAEMLPGVDKDMYITKAQGIHFVYNELEMLQNEFDANYGYPTKVTIENFKYWNGTKVITVESAEFKLNSIANRGYADIIKGTDSEGNEITVEDQVVLRYNTDADPTDIDPLEVHDVRLDFAKTAILDDVKPTVTYEWTHNFNFNKVTVTQDFEEYTRINPAIERHGAYPSVNDPLDFDGDLQYGNESQEFHFAYRNRISDVYKDTECASDWVYYVESVYTKSDGTKATVRIPWADYISNDNEDYDDFVTDYKIGEDGDISKAGVETEQTNWTVYEMFGYQPSQDDKLVQQLYFMPNQILDYDVVPRYNGAKTYVMENTVYDVKVVGVYNQGQRTAELDDVSFEFVDPFGEIGIDEAFVNSKITEQGKNEIQLKGSVFLKDYDRNVILKPCEDVEVTDRETFIQATCYNPQDVNAGPFSGDTWTERFLPMDVLNLPDAFSDGFPILGDLIEGFVYSDANAKAMSDAIYGEDGLIKISILDHPAHSTAVKALIESGDIYMNGTILTKTSAASGLPEGSEVYVHVQIKHRWSATWGDFCSDPIAIDLGLHGEN